MTGPDRPVIVHVCTRYRKGGSEQRLRDMVAAVDARHIVAVGAESDFERARNDLAPARVEMLDRLRRTPGPADGLVVSALTRLLTETGADLLVTHQSKAGLLGRAASRFDGIPVIHSLSMASTGPGYGRVVDRVYRAAERLAADWGVGYMVVGDDLRRRAVANGVRPDRCHVVRSAAPLPTPGIDRRLRRRAMTTLGDVANRPWIVSVGALEARKRTDQFPAVLGIARRLLPDADPQLIVAGDGPERDRLTAVVAARGLQSSVRLLGHIDWAPELIAAADVLVMASRAEGLPQVMVQAASADTPFVAYEVDGPTELLSMGARGTVVPVGDRAGMAKAVTGWLGRRQESTDSRIDLSSWDPTHIADRYRRVVAGVVDPLAVAA